MDVEVVLEEHALEAEMTCLGIPMEVFLEEVLLEDLLEELEAFEVLLREVLLARQVLVTNLVEQIIPRMLMPKKSILHQILSSFHVQVHLQEECLPCHRLRCRQSCDLEEHSELCQCFLCELAYNESQDQDQCIAFCGKYDT